jgi:catechol-2,3-dioxygenase
MSDMDQPAIEPIARAERPIAAGTTIGHVHLRTAGIDRVRDDLELHWDRPQSEWALDEHGHLAFAVGELELEDLLARR